MNKPKMIIFDYGQTLVDEEKFDGSNICYAGKVIKKRISKMLPNHQFEFILATSEYMFRKPNKRIFGLAFFLFGIWGQ